MNKYIEISIYVHCVCGQKLKVETDFIDDDIVLSTAPCQQCLEKAKEGLFCSWFDDWKFVPEKQLKQSEERHQKHLREIEQRENTK